MNKYDNYFKWSQLTVAQRKQVKSHKSLKGINVVKAIANKYEIDANGNFTGSYIDAYLLSGFFSI